MNQKRQDPKRVPPGASREGAIEDPSWKGPSGLKGWERVLEGVAFEADPSGIVLKMGAGIEALTERAPAAWIGRPIEELLLEADRPALRALFENGSPAAECRLTGSGEQPRWLRITTRTLIRKGRRRVIAGLIRDITEARRLEWALEASRFRFQEVIDHIHEVFWIASQNLDKMIYVSSAYDSIWGKSRESLYANPLEWAESIDPGDRERVLREIRKARRDQSSFDLEYRIVRPDGSIRWIHDRGFPVFDPGGQVTRATGLAEDVTERKTMAEALRDREAEFKALAENSPDVIVRLDREGRFLYVNPAAEVVSGITAEAHIGKSPAEAGFPPALAELWARAARRVVASGEGMGLEFEMPSPKGNRFIDARHVPERGTDGSLQSILVVARDVTAQRQATQALRESEQRYRQLFERNLAGVYRCVLDGPLLECNDAFARIFGFDSCEEVMEASHSHHFSASEQEYDRFAALLKEKGSLSGFETRGRRRDGALVHLLENATLLKGQPEAPEVIEGTILDITGRHRALVSLALEHALARALAEAASLDEAGPEVLRLLCAGLECEAAFLWRADWAEGVLRCEASWREESAVPEDFFEQARQSVFAPFEDLPGQAWATGRPILFTEGRADAAPPRVTAALAAGFLTALAFPATGNGGVTGVLTLYSRQILSPEPEFLETISALSSQIGRFLKQEAERQEQRLLNSALEQTDEGCMITDVKGTILYVNPAFERITGFGRNDAVGRTPALLESGAHTQAFFGGMWRAILAGRAWAGQVTNRRKDGALFRAQLLISPMRNGGGEISRFVCTFRDVTDAVKAAEAMRDSEERYRSLVAHSPDGILLVDLKGNFLSVNEIICRKLGYSEQELLSMSLWDIVPPGQWETHKERLARILKGESLDDAVEYAVVSKSGKKIPVEVRSAPYRKGEEIVGFQAIARDVSDRKQAERRERALYAIAHAAAGSRTLQEIYRSVHEAIGSIMPAGNFYIALLDETRTKIHFPYFVDEKDPPPPPLPLGEGLTSYVLRTRRSLLADAEAIEALRREGAALPAGSDSAVWLGAPLMSGRRAMGVIAVQSYSDAQAYDEEDLRVMEFVSSEVARALERAAAEERIRKGQEEYRTLVNNLGEGITMVDGDETVLLANPAAEAIFGVPPGGLAGRNLREFFDAAAFETIRRETSLRKEGQTSRYELPFRRAGGETRTIRVTAVPQFGPEGHFKGTFGVIDDVTKERKRAEELQRARGLESVGLVAGGVAHEVRNPLFAISTIVAALEKKLADQPEFGEYVLHIQDQVRRLNDLMSDLLVLGRPVEASAFSPCVLKDLLNEAHRQLEAASSSRREWAIQEEDGTLVVNGSAEKLVQVLLNIASNAEAFSPDGEAIRVRLWRESDRACAAISDSGPGIPDEVLDKIFQPFASRRKGGTGLGLAIVQKIVEAHGGTVEAANNDPPPGATFTVKLPLASKESIKE